MADQTANVVAWSAGVSVMSATLAGILASRATTPLSQNPWFILCIVIAIVSFAVLLLVGPRLVWTWRRDRHRRYAPSTAPAPDSDARPAADQQIVPAINPDEFRPYHQESGEFPDGRTLTFGFDHINDHPGAYIAVNPRRCTVVTPSGVTVSATRPNRYFQYPQEFENAPPVRPGLYRFRFEGQLQNGEWAFITEGEYEVKPPLITEIVESGFENWKRIALIAALRVKVTNTTGAKIRLSGIGFTYDPEGLPGLGTTLSGDERLELDRVLDDRRERQHYGIPLRNYAMVPAGESITGWVVETVTRRSEGGTPSCTVVIKDELGNEYRATLPKRELQTYG